MGKDAILGASQKDASMMNFWARCTSDITMSLTPFTQRTHWLSPTLLALALAWSCGGGAAQATATQPSSAAPTQALATAVSNAPLGLDQAVALALQRSPALQALVADNEAQQARVQAGARPGLLRLSLSRMRQGDDIEVERGISVGLIELLTWPWRARAADARTESLRQQQSLSVLNHAQAVRQQWVLAVAARQKQQYQNDILTAAQTGATLAQRMQDAGHLSAAQAAQEALVAAQAQLDSTRAQQQAVAQREALLRLIGLSGDEATQLTLPDRLPDVPTQPAWQAEQLGQSALQSRMDTRLAQAQWQALQRTSTDNTLRSWVDIEGGFRRKTTTGQSTSQGPELSFALMATDLGAARRRSMQADEQAALAMWQQAALSAESQLRESWANYLSQHQAALHARDVLKPIRQQLLEERLKQYNGMLIGPLDLLREARAHTGAVIQAIDAQQAYWLADLAVRAATEGSTAPTSMASSGSGSASTAADAGAH